MEIAGSNPVGSGFDNFSGNPLTYGEDSPLVVPSQLRKQRRPGPANPRYGVPRDQWPNVVQRIEQGESLRRVAKDYGVSYETIRRVLRAMRQEGGE